MEFLTADWLGTPLWFWLSFFGLVITLTAFDLGVLHKEDREMGIGESLKLTAFYIAIAMAFGAWIWIERGAELTVFGFVSYASSGLMFYMTPQTLTIISGILSGLAGVVWFVRERRVTDNR